MKGERVGKTDIDQMLKMRSEGCLNQEIAEALGWAYNTVIAKIGRQPVRNRPAPYRLRTTQSSKNIHGHALTVKTGKKALDGTRNIYLMIDYVLRIPLEHVDEFFKFVDKMKDEVAILTGTHET